MFAPVPLVVIGFSLIVFPGAKLTRKEIHDDNISFWSVSPKAHKIFWLLFGVIGMGFLVLQLLVILEATEVSFHNCFAFKYLGIGQCV